MTVGELITWLTAEAVALPTGLNTKVLVRGGRRYRTDRQHLDPRQGRDPRGTQPRCVGARVARAAEAP